jgi:two-component system, OmpR family, sensor kinase
MTRTTTTAATTGTTTTEPRTPARDARPPRSGVSVRTRITATVALLVTLTLAGAGLIVYAIEVQRIEEDTIREVQQELDEFGRTQERGLDPETQQPYEDLRALFDNFLVRNVPDNDELLVGWVGDAPQVQSPNRDPLPADPDFQDAARPLVTEGGTTRIQTDRGEVLITAQPVQQRGGQTGALIVVNFLAEDRSELLDTMRTYAIVAALSLALVTGLAAWQSGRLLAPLRTLRSTADEISETDLSRRIPETGNDDITALTRTVNGMLDRLEAAFVGQREFLDDAGHELKTPLTVLRGHLELLEVADPEEVAETRELLLDEIDRMARLVNDLILLAKSDRPDFVTPADTELAALTDDVLAKARGLGPRDWRLDQVSDATVRIDGQRITQALLQLADNAVKHTRDGDTVAIGSSYTEGWARLWVRDSGSGVHPEDRAHIFARFGRASVPENDEGFGLGLSIVRAIAVAHGGDVHVTDAEPRGAEFVITLPTESISDDATQILEVAPWPES